MESVKDTPVRFDIKAEELDFAHFIEAVKLSPQLVQTSFTPSDDKNHFVIYKFTEGILQGAGKCVVVYDTKAGKISLTARADVLERFKQLYIKRDSLIMETRANIGKANSSAMVVCADKSRLPTEHRGKNLPRKAAVHSTESKIRLQDKVESKQKKASTKNAGTSNRSDETHTSSDTKLSDNARPLHSVADNDSVPEYKNGYAIKKYARRRLEEALKGVKAMRGVSCKPDAVANKGKPDEAETYMISGSGGQKVILRYMPKKEILQIQGRRCHLFSDVQVLLLKDADFKSVVVTRDEPEKGKNTQNASTMQRRLKKVLPDAFELLGEQSKMDLTIGYIDINNSETKLSDYSSLLTPPYRGLEKFISDLQKARGIEVKMIGQGYEKDDDGNYRLKSGYRKRIDSVVYNEVMSALYVEYFSRRNFYTHSDFSGDGAPRIITDKQEVKRIFDHLIEVLNYNGKKLKEIGFTIRTSQSAKE
ncbi:MAG: hypothetical protein HFK09_07500 [Clostridia bacterium]|nr:hypothetical protein [Clostridia bacterium]